MAKATRSTRKTPPPLDRRPLIPLGDPIDWSAADIARMAEVTEEDKVAALAFWQANSSPAMKGLPQARTRKRKP